MIRVGLVGEDPNDTQSISNLLAPLLNGKGKFISLLRNKFGYQLDNANTVNSLKIEVQTKKPAIIIFIRDLDGLATEKRKITLKENWFNKLSKEIKTSNLLLLNIWELEALILADIETFNSCYHTQIKFPGEVTLQKDPKEFLKQKTNKLRKQFKESHCPEIFSHLDLAVVRNRCGHFNSFVKKFEKLIAEKAKQ